MQVAVDSQGYLLTLLVTPTNAQGRAQVGALAQGVEQAKDQSSILHKRSLDPALALLWKMKAVLR